MMSIFTEENLKNIPALYEQDGKGEKAVVHLLVKLRNFVWLITEYNPEEELFFGFVCLDDVEMAEIGYISKSELEDLEENYPSITAEKIEMTLKEAKNKYIKD